MYSPILSEWFKRDYAKPIILLGENSFVKNALVYSNFNVHRDITQLSTSDEHWMERPYREDHLYLIRDEVINHKADYSYCAIFASQINIKFIIIPSDYLPFECVRNDFIMMDVKNVYPDKDWYWWVTELEKAGCFD